MNSRKKTNREVYNKIHGYQSRENANGIFVKENPNYFQKVVYFPWDSPTGLRHIF